MLLLHSYPTWLTKVQTTDFKINFLFIDPKQADHLKGVFLKKKDVNFTCPTRQVRNNSLQQLLIRTSWTPPSYPSGRRACLIYARLHQPVNVECTSSSTCRKYVALLQACLLGADRRIRCLYNFYATIWGVAESQPFCKRSVCGPFLLG